MSINFEQIKWKNFLSTGNIFTEVSLNNLGTTLIIGENGAGKSTILDALTFALFGKPFRNINKPQLSNSITKKDTVVELVFSTANKKYKIIRGIKPVIFEIYCNDVMINQSAEMKDYQEILEKQILKVNYKSFCQVVVLGSASFVPFMQLPGGQRRAIIEDLLDLEVFTLMNTLLKDKIQDNTTDTQKNQNDINLINEKIKLVSSHLEEIRLKNKQFIDSKKQAILDYQTKINNIDIDIKETIKKYDELESAIEDSSSISKKLDSLKIIRTKLETKHLVLNKEISFFTSNNNCPTCKQHIDENFKCDAIKNKSVERQEIEEGIDKLLSVYKEADDKLKNIFKSQTDFDAIRTLRIQQTGQRRFLQEQIDVLQKEIETTKILNIETSNIKISDLEKEKLILQNKYNDLKDDKNVLNAAVFLLKDGGIKTKIINQYIPVINNLVNKYLSMMDFFVDFQMNAQFEEIIKSRHRDDFSYASFSEGEKQKIDLSLLFTWRAVAKMRNSVNTNLLILDEVFDSSLDINGTEQLMNIIQNLAADNSLFIISHKEQTGESKFDRTIKFVKNKNFSQIVE
jgi:DNA repair exonuclease SbcCD ATPase subunit